MAEEQHDTIDDLSTELRRFPPPEGFKADALVTGTDLYDEAAKDDEGFWANQASELITWSKPWDTILEWELPYAKWFVGGELNVSYNCLDRHVEAGRGDKVAFHWEGEPGDSRTITYAELLDDVQRFANVLKSLGVAKGDRVNIYMPMIPEVAVAMLACARIGAAHSVVFGGFSAQALADRITDAEATVLITADGGYRRGEVFPLKAAADDAVANAPTIQHVIVVKRGGNDVTMVDGRDHWYHELMEGADPNCPPEPMDVRAAAVPAVHERHHRQAEGHHAHVRRVPHPRRLHAQVRVRSPPRHGHLLVHRRRRLGHRPQLHRLRPARQRSHPGDVRGRAELPWQRPLVGDRREVRRDDPVHRADGDQDVHEMGGGRAANVTT